MSVHSFDGDSPFRERRGRNRGDRRGRVDQGGREERRARWERGEHPEHHEDPHEHHGRGRGRHGGFGMPPLPPPPGPFGFGGPEFWEGGPGFGPRGHRRGRGRAGRGDVRAAIIALLDEEPRNGYQIIQEIEQRTDGVWRASSGSVYPALAQLEDERLIEPMGGGGRKLFALTEAGRQHAQENAEHLSRLWQEAVGPGERFVEFARNRDLIAQLIMAYRQVTQVGSDAQQQEARAVLTKARQSLYKILAADADEEPREDQPGE